METKLGCTEAAGISRRKLIMTSMLGGAALVGGGAVAIAPSRPLRFAHLTDPHLWDHFTARDGFAKVIERLAALSPAVDFVITGGDHVMEAFDVEPAKAARQWDVYDRAIESVRRRMSIYPVLGNHDLLGWDRREGESDYGKTMALDRLGMATPYYSFDRGRWHFICLDNIARRGGGYIGALDEQQKEWLKADLQRTGHQRPICVVTHIPLLSACVFFDPASNAVAGTHRVACSDMHEDVRGIVQLLGLEDRKYNVRLAISGHIHLRDRVDYSGTSFICGGAASGNWWRGDWAGYRSGFGVYELHEDGRFEHVHVFS